MSDHAPIEVHLPDGGHLILSIADRPTRLSGGALLIDALLRAVGSEQDLERRSACAASV